MEYHTLLYMLGHGKIRLTGGKQEIMIMDNKSFREGLRVCEWGRGQR